MPRSSRLTIPVDAQPGLAETDVSASIRSTNGVPFIVERAMYFSRPEQIFAAGHESAGVTAPATRWFLAEGATGSFFNMFILIANPSAPTATVEMQYLLDGRRRHHGDAHCRGAEPLDDQCGARRSGAGVRAHVDDHHVDEQRADRRRARDVVAGGTRRLDEAHNSPGEITTGTRWALAEGESGGAQASRPTS